MNRSLVVTLVLCLGMLLLGTPSGAMEAPSPVAPQNGTIGGEILYRGTLPGEPPVDALLFDTIGGAPLTGVPLPFPGGAFDFGDGPDGTYYVAAQIDPNGSGGPPDPGEPFAWYDGNLDGTPDPIAVSGGDVDNIDILLPATPFWSQAGEQAQNYYGEAVGAAGDVNGDGYDELLVGAYQYDEVAAAQAGRAYLYYGTATGLNTTPQIISAPVLNANGFFGMAASGAGDVNGDGYDDILISMPNYENGPTPDEGAVFVWYGSESGIDGSYDWHAESDLTYGHMGLDFGAGTAGDVNGDGYDDIIAGAVRYDLSIVAHAFVWFGSENGLDPGSRPVGTPANADWTAAAPTGAGNAANWFGRVTGTAGDVNGDGYDDVFVGAHDHESTASEENEGGIYVWYGSQTGLGAAGTMANADWSAEGNQAGARLGYHAAAAGDVNGDGYDDFAVGAYLYDGGAGDEGLLQLYYGSASGLVVTPGWTAEGEAPGMQLGLNVGSGADINGDGYDDLLASGPGYDAAALSTLSNAGATMAWYGGVGGPEPNGTPLNADWLATGDMENASFGSRLLNGRADFDGDGLADVAAGAPSYDNPGQSDGGRAFAYFGVPDPIVGLTATGVSPLLLGQGTTLTATVEGGTAIVYNWETGDGFKAGGPVIEYVYEAAGTFTATVTATNTVHSRTATTVIEVLEGVAGLAATNDGPTLLDQPTTFGASVTAGSDVSYEWDFDDGNSGSGATPSHTYAAAGTYTATVTASNAVSTATATTTVNVEAEVTGPSVFLPLLKK